MLAETQRSPAADRASANVGSGRTSSAKDSHSFRALQRLDRIIRQAGGNPWLALPQVPTRHSGGGSGWAAIVKIDDQEVLDQLRDAVLTEWRERCERVPLPERGRRAWQ